MFGIDNICHRVWLGRRELAGGQSFQKSLQGEVSFRWALENENYLSKAEGGGNPKR